MSPSRPAKSMSATLSARARITEEMTRLAEQQPQQWQEQGPGRWYRPVLAIGAENGSTMLAVLGYRSHGGKTGLGRSDISSVRARCVLLWIRRGKASIQPRWPGRWGAYWTSCQRMRYPR